MASPSNSGSLSTSLSLSLSRSPAISFATMAGARTTAPGSALGSRTAAVRVRRAAAPRPAASSDALRSVAAESR